MAFDKRFINYEKFLVHVDSGHRPKTLAFIYTDWPPRSVAICSISYSRSITRKLMLGSQLILRSSMQSCYVVICSFHKKRRKKWMNGWIGFFLFKLTDITYQERQGWLTYTACLDFWKTDKYHFPYFRNINKYLTYAINITGSVDFKQLTSTRRYQNASTGILIDCSWTFSQRCNP